MASVEGTNEYLEALSEAVQICAGVLLEVEDGITTWAHPEVAIEFASWCSVGFTGLEIKKAPYPRHVEKNPYHHDVWRLAYPGIELPETTTLVIQS